MDITLKIKKGDCYIKLTQKTQRYLSKICQVLGIVNSIRELELIKKKPVVSIKLLAETTLY